MKRQIPVQHHGVWIFLLATCLQAGFSPARSITDSGAQPFLDNSPHGTTSCTFCHFSAPGQSRSAKLYREGKCLSCHSGKQGNGTMNLGFHGKRDQDCSRCHSYHSPDEILVPGGRMSLATLKEAGEGHCRSCHGAGGHLADLSDSHRLAANRYHGDLGSLAGLSPSQGCLLCHAADSGSSWQKSFPTAATTFNRHTSHPLGVPNRATRPANAFLIRRDPVRKLPLFEGRIECQTCHQITTRNEDLVVTFGEKQDLCLGCHQRNGGRNVLPSDLTAAMAIPR